MNFSLILTIFLFLIPLIGGALSSAEAFFFYGGVIYLLFISKWADGYRQGTPFLSKYRIILLIFAIISVITSKNVSPSYYYLINLIFISTFLDLILRHVKVKMLFQYLLYFSLLYSFIFLLNKVGLIPLSKDGYGDNFILQVWGHSYLAELLVFPIVTMFYQLISKRKVYPYSKLLNYLILLLLITCLFLTNSRSAFITILISILYSIITSLKSVKLKIFYCLTAILFTFCAYFLLSQNATKTIDGNRLEYWHQAYQAFISRPLFGYGPNNFNYINKLFQSRGFTGNNHAHNSPLEYLSTYGLFFTGFFYALIFSALIYQKKHSPLNFILGLTGIVNSLFESSWRSLGILCLSLFFIFYNYPKLYTANKSTHKSSSILKYSLLIIFLSTTLSDLASVNKKYLLSVSLNPFNPNPRINLIRQGINLKSNSIFLANHINYYNYLINRQEPQPSNLLYFHKIIDLNPRESISEYTLLSRYYYQNKDFDKLKEVLDKVIKYIDIKQFPTNNIMEIAKISYRAGIDCWNESNLNMAMDYLGKAAYFSQGYSHFQIELANAYWHTGNKDLALKQLETECYKYPASIKHCQEYLEGHQNNFLKPGTTDFQDSINNIQ